MHFKCQVNLQICWSQAWGVKSLSDMDPSSMAQSAGTRGCAIGRLAVARDGYVYQCAATWAPPQTTPAAASEEERDSRHGALVSLVMSQGKEVLVNAMDQDWDWYSVHVEARPPADTQDLKVDQGAADALMDLLEDYDGIVSAGTARWEATVSVRGHSVWDAVIYGGPLIEKMAIKAGLPCWHPIRVEGVLQDVLDAENARPTLPELVSVPEAAEILGVSQQRVRELAGASGSFPEPMYELRTGKLWLRDAIDAFAQNRERKPGRPRKAADKLHTSLAISPVFNYGEEAAEYGPVRLDHHQAGGRAGTCGRRPGGACLRPQPVLEAAVERNVTVTVTRPRARSRTHASRFRILQ